MQAITLRQTTSNKPPRSIRQRGQALIEGALTILFTMMFLFGAIDMAQVLMGIQWSAERARATARWAATHSATPTQIKAYAAYGDPNSGRTNAGLMNIRPQDVTVTVTGAGTPSHRITVTIQSRVEFYLPFLPRNYAPKPGASTVMAESLGSTGSYPM